MTGAGRHCNKSGYAVSQQTAGPLRSASPCEQGARHGSQFHLKKAKDGQFHFNLHAANGEIILTSELYKAKDSALGGIESVRKNSQRDGAFEVKPASNGKFHFVLKATNGQVVGQSQLYASQANAEAGVQSVKRAAPEAGLSDES